MQLSEELVYHVQCTRDQNSTFWLLAILLGRTQKKVCYAWHSRKIKNHSYVNPFEPIYTAIELCYVILFLVMLVILLWAA